MSTETLATGSGSSSTLLTGCDLVSQPLSEMIQLKQEPEDEEELEIRRQMQVRVGLGNPSNPYKLYIRKISPEPQSKYLYSNQHIMFAIKHASFRSSSNR